MLSALGRLERAGRLDDVEADGSLALSELPIERHAVSPLLLGAWTLRDGLRLADGLYVELARQLGMRLITTDRRLARAAPVAGDQLAILWWLATQGSRTTGATVVPREPGA